MLINPIIRHLIHNKGVVGTNKAQWIKLIGLPGGDLAILNSHALQTLHERITLWQELIKTLPNECRWIFCRDSNMVEDALDKSSKDGRIILERERVEFD